MIVLAKELGFGFGDSKEKKSDITREGSLA
jgi:hypothetical protein